MNTIRIGIDLAKNSFQLHGVGADIEYSLERNYREQNFYLLLLTYHPA